MVDLIKGNGSGSIMDMFGTGYLGKNLLAYFKTQTANSFIHINA